MFHMMRESTLIITPEKVMRSINDLVATSTFFTEDDQSEMILIQMYDLENGVMRGTGEESGEEYEWNLNEIDLSTASWWKIVPNV